MLTKILNLFFCLIVLNFCFNFVAQVKGQKVSPKNWITFNNETWPPIDGTSSTPFFLAYSESARNPIFELNKNLFSTFDGKERKPKSLLTKPNFSFRYWTNSDLGLFIYKKPHSNQHQIYNLDQTYKWTDTKIENILPEELAGLQYTNNDNYFSFALKDVVVEVTERVNVSILPLSLIHSYKSSSPFTSNIAETETPKSILSVDSNFATIHFEHSETKLQSFQFELLPSPSFDDSLTTLVNLTLSKTKNSCDVKAYQNGRFFYLKNIATIECAVKEEQIISFNLTLIMKFSSFILIPKQQKTTQLKVENFKLFGQTYKVDPKENSSTFISFIDNQTSTNDVSKDMCYIFLQIDNKLSNQPLITFNIYLTYPKAPSGLYLDQITTPQKSFCLNDYIGFRLLKNYQLTLVVAPAQDQHLKKLPSSFRFFLAKKEIKSNFNLVTPDQYSNKVPFTRYWHYSNRVFNYQITGPKTTFSVCDITGNCFPYTRNQISSSRFQYDIPDEYLNEISRSPFLRVKCDKCLATDDKFIFGYDKNSAMHVLLSTRKLFYALNEQFASKVSTTSNLQTIVKTAFKNSTRYDLHIPISSIDLRVSHLSFKLQGDPFNSKDQPPLFAFKSLTFNNTKTKVVNDFNKLYKFKLLNQTFKIDDDDETEEKVNLNKLPEIDISTEDFFYFDSFETNSTIDGYFTLSVEVVLKEGKEKDNVKLVFELQNANEILNYKKSKLKTMPVLIKSDPKILNPLVSTQLVYTSGQIFFKKELCNSEQQLPFFKIKLLFDKSNNLLARNDIKIYRIIKSQNTFTNVDLTEHLQINKTTNATATFEDQNDSKLTVNCEKLLYFEIIYQLTLSPDCKNEIEVTLEDFKVSQPNSEANNQLFLSPIIGTVDPKYFNLFSINCPYLFSKANQENTTFCQLNTAYYLSKTTCSKDTGCSNIFSTSLPTSKIYYNQQTEKITQNRYFPNRLTTKTSTDESQYLQVSLNRTSTGNETHSNEVDYCLQFKFSSESKKSAIRVTFNPKSKYNIDFLANQVLKNTQNHIVCQSWFSPNFASVNELYFRFEDSLKAVDLDTNYIEILPNPKWDSEIVSLESGITRKKLDQTEWRKLFMDIPTVENVNFKLDTYGQVEYLISNLQTLKTGSNHLVSSKLQTRWIKSMNKLKDQLYLTLSPSGDAYRKQFLNVSITVSSEDGPIFTSNLNNFDFSNKNELFLFNLTQSVTYYQLTFTFDLDLTKVTSETSASIKFTDISINDACSSNLNSQNNNSCSSHGSCVTANYHNFTNSCECNPGFSGSTCSKMDYCTALNEDTNIPNSQACKGLKCISNLELKTFTCECLTDRSWNSVTGSCLATKMEDCGENEVRELGKSGSSTCVCQKGFIRFNKTCTSYDVCNEDHRKANKEAITKPCADVNAECKPKQQNDVGKTDYECICKAEFYNEFEIKTSKAKCLSEICKNCDQKCSFDVTTKKYFCVCEKGYDLDQGSQKCIPNPTIDPSKCKNNDTSVDSDLPQPFLKTGSCSCPSGFRFNLKTKTCDVDQALAVKFGCTKVELKKSPLDDQPGCVCLDGQQFDASTRRCLPTCTQERAKDCSARGAQCTVLKDKVECQCAEGAVRFTENYGHLIDAICMDKCQLIEKYPQFASSKCSGQFQRCDSKKVTVSGLHMLQTFLLENSTISSTPSQHCSCDFGFERQSNGQCTVSSTSIKFIRDLSFELPLSITGEEEKRTYASETIRPAFLSLLRSLFKKFIIKEKSICQVEVNKVLCTGAITPKLSSSQIVERMSSSCVLSNDNKTCMYFTEENVENEYFQLVSFASSRGPRKLVNVLARDATKPIKVEPINYCASPDRCSSAPNSHCKNVLIKEEDNEEKSFFECLCEPTFFTPTSSQTLFTTSTGRSLQLQSCAQRNLCTEEKEAYACSDPTAICSLVLTDHKNGSYSGKTFCTCPGGIVLPSRDRLCQSSSCDGKCQNEGECVVDLFSGQKVFCKCKEAFEGDNCEKNKLDVASSQESLTGVSSGYKVATIVLSVFFSLGLIVLIFVVVKKLTGFNVVLYVNQLIRRDR